METFNQISDLMSFATQQVSDALEETMEQLLDSLLKFIEEDIYNNYTPKFYDRTEEVKDKENWKIVPSSSEGCIGYKIMFTPIKWTTPTDNYRNGSSAFTHGNYMFGELQANDLLRILNGDFKSGIAFNFPPSSSIHEHFWDDFIDYTKNNINTLFQANCTKRGLIFIKAFTITVISQ